MLNSRIKAGLSTVAALMLMGCVRSPVSTTSESSSEQPQVDLRISEEPYQSQDRINRRMSVVTGYLKKATGLNIEYVPAINYAHSHAMLQRGLIDVLNVGVYGGHRLRQIMPSVEPLVVQKKSFRMVLLGRHRMLRSMSLSGPMKLNQLVGMRVGFGSRHSGAAFLQPLLEMKTQGFDYELIGGCLHEPMQDNLADLVAEGMVDFAFVASFGGDPLQQVPESLRSEVGVVWTSSLRRNDYFAAAGKGITPQVMDKLDQVRDALVALNPSTQNGKLVLDQWGYLGFELPSERFPDRIHSEIDQLLDETISLPSC
ncbi:putative ABC-type phosphate/phosphonate transport system/ periplasmic component [Synechococcus sp. PROS-7-1]|uniref:PhnD/SsuA/transferrin family substrate-binding protein n=1 Tax=Synechococcus sp. PROS-7-1 TaxID=1442556 RepID=UPI001861B408|nr:PhnD/SsuA/transferrin family substrate-binding protein [Synechococcus sp. PROS-7-1]QNI86561.1 putative ABC-type phosphate/phosphonate transport system/ periplasmic component [Synechococcus sp. PROS-7-1]